MSRKRLTRDDVVVAACALLDDDGLDGFTMAALGERLGVTGMAVYRHFENRAALEEAIAAHVLAGMSPYDESVPWDRGVSDWMQAARAALTTHPWVSQFLMQGRVMSTSWLQASSGLQRVLLRVGLSDRDAARELQRISRAAAGFALLEMTSPLSQQSASVAAATERLDGDDRRLWLKFAREFDRYSDDALYADVVEDTVERLRRKEAARRQDVARRHRSIA
jgi:AcrR family transcriptional regulator